jgi:hypothetical protein
MPDTLDARLSRKVRFQGCDPWSRRSRFGSMRTHRLDVLVDARCANPDHGYGIAGNEEAMPFLPLWQSAGEMMTNYEIIYKIESSLSISRYNDDVVSLLRGMTGPPIFIAFHHFSLASDESVDPQVAKYIKNHSLWAVVDILREVVKETLPEGSEVAFTVEGDGESDDEWLVANLRIKSPKAQAYDLYDKFVDAWIGRTTPANRKRVRLTYSAW